MASTTELLALLAGLHFLALVLIFQSTRIAVPFLEEFGIAVTGLSTTENKFYGWRQERIQTGPNFGVLCFFFLFSRISQLKFQVT